MAQKIVRKNKTMEVEAKKLQVIDRFMVALESAGDDVKKLEDLATTLDGFISSFVRI